MARPNRSAAAAPSASPWGWALLGAAVGLALALVLFAPARWLAQAVAEGSGGRVLLEEARGTVWTGSARLVLSGGADSRDATALDGRLHWRLRPAFDGIAATLQADCCMAIPWQLHATPRLNGLRLAVADADSRWPAALLTGLGTPWNTLQPEGQLSLATQGLAADWNAGRLVLAGQARLEARDISSRLSTLKPMGSYRLTLQGGDSATLQLETLDGALQLAGSGQWVGSRLHFDGTASAAPERVDALSNLLNIIGRRDGARSLIKVG